MYVDTDPSFTPYLKFCLRAAINGQSRRPRGCSAPGAVATWNEQTHKKPGRTPWTYPNLLRDPQFVKDARGDGRFVEFLEHYELIPVES